MREAWGPVEPHHPSLQPKGPPTDLTSVALLSLRDPPLTDPAWHPPHVSGHAEGAFELRTLLELRGLATAAGDVQGGGDVRDWAQITKPAWTTEPSVYHENVAPACRATPVGPDEPLYCTPAIVT